MRRKEEYLRVHPDCEVLEDQVHYTRLQGVDKQYCLNLYPMKN